MLTTMGRGVYQHLAKLSGNSYCHGCGFGCLDLEFEFVPLRKQIQCIFKWCLKEINVGRRFQFSNRLSQFSWVKNSRYRVFLFLGSLSRVRLPFRQALTVIWL